MKEGTVRIEHDLLGEMKISEDSYLGIHTIRAVRNFPLTKRNLHPRLIEAYVEVKKAAAFANAKCNFLTKEQEYAILCVCDIILEKLHMQFQQFDEIAKQEIQEDVRRTLQSWFPVDPLSGGAGTSINMNMNEVIANLALEHMGVAKGRYDKLHPLNHVNLSQSTNDTFPTAVRIAAIRLLAPVSEAFAALQTELQKKEDTFASILKVGRTELNDAVPITVGQEFGAWARAIARDRWRLYKAEERLRQINLGGTAVGTGMNAETAYIFHVTEKIREITGLGLARSEYMMDVTQNMDVFVEVAGLVKTAAVDLGKIASDLRLLGSGPIAGIGEIRLPVRQAGSTIMPGKVNPVICEAVNQAVYRILGLESIITNAALGGQLELNAFLPVISDSLFEMLDLIRETVKMFTRECIEGIQVNEEHCRELVEKSLIKAPAYVPALGYDMVTRLMEECRKANCTMEELILEQGLLSESKVKQISSVVGMTTPGIRK